MGYTGLATVCDSDRASDLQYVCRNAYIAALSKGLKDKGNTGNTGNTYNTDGIVNVALIIESGELDSFDWYNIDEHLDHAKLVKGLEEKVLHSSEKYKGVWNDEHNRLLHHNAYTRLLKCVEKFIKKKSNE